MSDFKIITNARYALWKAIAASEATKGKFRREIRVDGKGKADSLRTLLEPAASELPAIRIRPVSIKPAWFTGQFQEWPIVFETRIWTPEWNYDTAEEMVARVFSAFWTGSESKSVTIVKEATGHYPGLGSFKIDLARLADQDEDAEQERGSGTKVAVADFTVAVKVNQGPFSG